MPDDLTRQQVHAIRILCALEDFMVRATLYDKESLRMALDRLTGSQTPAQAKFIAAAKEFMEAQAGQADD